MFRKLTDGLQSTLAQAGEQAKTRNQASGVPSPRSSATIDRTTRPAPVHVSYEEGDLETGQEDSDGRPDESVRVDGVPLNTEAQTSTTSTEMSPELQKKLNKLAKYELKYPELLKAYRALQVTDANVKTFEKALGDITPATSIQDVEAFQQWANNFTLKTEMSMTELRRVGQELVTLESETRDKNQAHDAEISGLKQRIAELQSIEASADSAENSSKDNARIVDLEATIAEYKVKLDTFSEQKLEIERLESVNKELTTLLEDQKQKTIVADRNCQSAEKSRKRSVEEAQLETSEVKEEIAVLKKNIVELKVQHAQELRKAQSTAQPLEIAAQASTTPEQNKDEETVINETPLSKGQKKRKNKKKAATRTTEDPESAHATAEAELNTDVQGDSATQIQALIKERNELQVTLDTLRATSESFDEERFSYEKKIRKLTEHQESIEEMRDMVKEVGNDLVEARDSIKVLTEQKAVLQQEIMSLKSSITSLTADNTQLMLKVSALQEASIDTTNTETLSKEKAELEVKLATSEEKLKSVSKDLEIAGKLSAERFKELSTTRDSLRLRSSELNEIKTQNQKLSGDNSDAEMSLKSSEARAKALERAEKDRRDELGTCQKNLASREKELKVIQNAFKEEEARRKSEENRASALKSEVTKLTALRDSIISSRNELTGQLSSMRLELDNANTKLASLTQIRNKLVIERDAAQEELQMGQAKFDSSQSLMESQREQTVDMQHRMREAVERYEAMEEELSEAQRQLTERGREAETLRRLLSEIQGNQESRLRDMRERMESAISERDKAEDEAAFNGKKRAREVEDLKEKLLDAERALRKVTIEKQDLAGGLDELRKAKDAISDQSQTKEQDLRDLREAMNDLSQSMRESEAQISVLEQERDSLRSVIKDSSGRIDRLNAEITAKDDLLHKLRNERAHMLDRQDSYQSPVQPRRTSHNPSDSIGSVPQSPSTLRSSGVQSPLMSEKPKEKTDVDREYIKNVLFQFLEHKDKRKYLMPAISKLLVLSKQQEGVFTNALK